MAGLAIIGAQWGDEGKGKVVDLLAAKADVVARFQGGPNAGHTLVVEGRKVVLHAVPSGVLYPGKANAVGPGCIVDAITCLEEVRELVGRGRLQGPGELTIDQSCHIILPVHRALDVAREAASGRPIGTTGRGIGPCYEDLVGRRGLRFVDLADPAHARRRVDALLVERNALLQAHGAPPMTTDEVLGPVLDAAEALAPYLGDARGLVGDTLDAGGRVLFEGAQGTYLDPLHGTYPYVTSTPCVAAAAASGTGVGPGAVGAVLGTAKAYTTRVGAGPFPTELEGEEGERFRELGAEYGATTGRPRRCGWLDLPMLRQTARLNGLTALAVTKLDVLSGFGALQVCVAYEHEGRRLDRWPAHLPTHRVRPVLEEVPGWEEPLGEASSIEALPAAARSYLERIARAVGVPVALVSVGPDREQTIRALDPWPEPAP